ncbi:uncharacterized protein LOC119990325 isoform X2 [Tripterygium wilfordii]|uniref:uncharacterized protein LOC119990325 isoform X2 n=1 Tax=Tripterygium wilfordii TaxID=458696 RepID=UPI0018F803C4|nr:uncharacterized protein LOC119990325 isoform X2 [Tripterygium wilfordii]
MKLKERNKVEVLRQEHEPCGSWYPGIIVLVDGDDYVVRYRFLTDQKGTLVMEKVHRVDVRPQPPHKMGKRWKVGDVVEVFEIPCWRVGKVVKVLEKDRFVVRLPGSIHFKEFHGSNVRIRQVWDSNTWSTIGKVAQNKEFANGDTGRNREHSSSISRALLPVKGEDSWSEKKKVLMGDLRDARVHLKIQDPVRKTKRSFGPSSSDLLVGGRSKKRKSRQYMGECDGDLFDAVDNISSETLGVEENFSKGLVAMDTTMGKATTNGLHTSSWPHQSMDNDGQGFVASCSSNNSSNERENSDTESSFPSLASKKQVSLLIADELEFDIHELELCAYKSTMQALYASGPLSWEQESLLTNLRLSLHISDEEHLLQVRFLLSAQAL